MVIVRLKERSVIVWRC